MPFSAPGRSLPGFRSYVANNTLTLFPLSRLLAWLTFSHNPMSFHVSRICVWTFHAFESRRKTHNVPVSRLEGLKHGITCFTWSGLPGSETNLSRKP